MIGLVIYGCGSFITAVAPTVAVLTLGWSILEGIGAAMVLPAMAALIAGNFEGRQRRSRMRLSAASRVPVSRCGTILGGRAISDLGYRAPDRRSSRRRTRLSG